VELGLADRLGDARGEAKRRFGPKARLVPVGGPRRPLLQRLLPSISADAAIAALEERAAWARLGL
jgi:serine protease SohB